MTLSRPSFEEPAHGRTTTPSLRGVLSAVQMSGGPSPRCRQVWCPVRTHLLLHSRCAAGTARGRRGQGAPPVRARIPWPDHPKVSASQHNCFGGADLTPRIRTVATGVGDQAQSFRSPGVWEFVSVPAVLPSLCSPQPLNAGTQPGLAGTRPPSSEESRRPPRCETVGPVSLLPRALCRRSCH